jgi:DNA repair photolyase
VLVEFRNPVFIITKNRLVTRDIDLLSELVRHQAAAVWLSITTLNSELRKVMEPRTAPLAARLAAIRELAQAGIPAGVNVAPVIPGLTDHEIPAILQAAAEAGATAAGFAVVRLPYAVAPLFEKWLETHFPDRKEKVLNRLRSLRGGKLNDSQWGKRLRGEGIFADQMEQMFEVARRKAGIRNYGNELSVMAFRRPPGAQLPLFS